MRWQLVLGTLGVALLGGIYVQRGKRPLTEQRILDDLGEDELGMTVFTMDEKFIPEYRCREDDITSIDEERDAAKAAGFIEQVCAKDPTVMRLTEKGRAASVRWRSQESESSTTLHRWDFKVARYERTGRPIVRDGATPDEKIVTIPGRWIPNEDGKTLRDAGFGKIAVVDREETFTYWRGVWARHHIGD